MKQILQEEGARPIKVWTDDMEPEALSQAKAIARLPFIHANGVALMPDVHAGKGATVGCVIATEKAIIPAAVGVDIGCGMHAVRLSLNASALPDSLSTLRSQIEQGVPLGAGGHHTDVATIDGHVGQLPAMSTNVRVALQMALGDIDHATLKAAAQLGTLGSGNHFIELCLDENNAVWIMLHSGSRGIGNRIGSYFIQQAKQHMARYFIHLPDADLAYLPESTADFDHYVSAVQWAQDYAQENRRRMMEAVLHALRQCIPTAFTVTNEAIACHHNYVERENHFGRNLWVTRKGAIRARLGELGIIPGSMGERSYIVRGKGAHQSYHSCSHGAGRRMSRTAARRQFTVADLIAQTAGVECRKDEAVLDEIPGAYKSIDTVMRNQSDLVEIVHTLKQVLCVKGA